MLLWRGVCFQVRDEEGWITFFPGPFANLTFGIDHRLVAPIIGDMWFTFHSDDTHFRCGVLSHGFCLFMRQLQDTRLWVEFSGSARQQHEQVVYRFCAKRMGAGNYVPLALTLSMQSG
jgi:hypothetical protein